MRIVLVGLVVVAFISGCASTFQHDPKPPMLGHAEQSCSTSNRLWIADAIGTALGAGALVGGRLYADAEPTHETLGYSVAGLGAVMGVLFFASMNEGRKWSSTCRERAPIAAMR